MSNAVEIAESGMEQQEPNLGWGKRLRAIREANSISLADVVAELRLEPKLIEQIEAEDLKQLPSTPFVKGYLRGYARMLNVDVTPILESYSQVCGEDAPGLTKVSRARELSSKDAAPRSTTWAIVAILVISVLVWWWSQIVTFKKTTEEAVVSGEQTPGDAVAIIDPLASGETTVALALPDQTASFTTNPNAAEAAAAVAAPEATVAPASPAVSSGSITLKFSQESWVDITDAKGERLFVDLAKADTTRTVTGQPPFNVLLGNSPAVTIEYNGAVYDHNPHASKGIARFTLGSAE